jgi:inosine-uridine nucleoside N-ribohydrolase
VAVRLCLVLILALSGCADGAEEKARPQASSSSAPVSPLPIVVDTDLGADDIIALALLLRSPAVDVRAITVSGTGLVRCPIGARHVRGMLVDLRVRDRPVGCGRGDPGPDGLAFPEHWRSASDAFYGLQLPPPMIDDGTTPDAVRVLNDAISSNPSKLAVIALGPWTNLEDLLIQHPQAVARVARIHAMAGAIHASGNAPGGAEWNVRADPSAFADVLRAIPTTLVPLDATNAVPLDPVFFDRLSADTSAPAANLAWRLIDKNRFLLTSGQSLWDELAAITLVEPTLLDVQPVRIQVGPTGQITPISSGREVEAAMGVNGSAAKTAILNALRGA